MVVVTVAHSRCRYRVRESSNWPFSCALPLVFVLNLVFYNSLLEVINPLLICSLRLYIQCQDDK